MEIFAICVKIYLTTAKDNCNADAYPCLYGGRCVNMPGSFRCICKTGLTGDICGTGNVKHY